jgi:tetratricopeptide (TPR) repeat protein
LRLLAAVLLATKNYSAAAPLMEYITTPKLHGQYAKVRALCPCYSGSCLAGDHVSGLAVALHNMFYFPLFLACPALAPRCQAKEASKDYAEAAKAYEKARDMDAVVRLLIDNLNAPERAGAIVRQTRSSEGAQLIAKYCKSVGDYRGAIEFLLLAKKVGSFACSSVRNNPVCALCQHLLPMPCSATSPSP